MKVVNLMDSILLDKFQKISDWIQNNFGYTNFDIARFLRFTMIISFGIREVLSFFNGIDVSEIFIMACSLMIIVKTEFILSWAQQAVEKNPAFINPVVSEYAITRLIMQLVGMAAFGLLVKHLYYILNPSVNVAEQYYQWKEFFWDLFGILIFLVSYFSSCTPKPYKPSKAKKSIEQTTHKIRQSVAVPMLSLNFNK